MKGKELSELHTHLLGMGNTEFWMHQWLGWYIPKRLQHFDARVFEENFSSGNIGEVMHDRLQTQGRVTDIYNNCINSSYDCVHSFVSGRRMNGLGTSRAGGT
jgi:hypothetical protein